MSRMDEGRTVGEMWISKAGIKEKKRKKYLVKNC